MFVTADHLEQFSAGSSIQLPIVVLGPSKEIRIKMSILQRSDNIYQRKTASYRAVSVVKFWDRRITANHRKPPQTTFEMGVTKTLTFTTELLTICLTKCSLKADESD